MRLVIVVLLLLLSSVNKSFADSLVTTSKLSLNMELLTPGSQINNNNFLDVSNYFASLNSSFRLSKKYQEAEYGFFKKKVYTFGAMTHQDHVSLDYLYGYAKFTKWGSIELGFNSNIAPKIHIGLASVIRNYAITNKFISNDLQSIYIIRDTSFANQFIDNFNKPFSINYYTRRVQGVKFAIGYADHNRKTKSDSAMFSYQNKYNKIFSLGVNYKKQYQDIYFALSTVYESGKANDKYLEGTVFSAMVNYRGISLLASLGKYGNTDLTVDNILGRSNYYSIGASYEIQGYQIALSYMNSSVNNVNLYENWSLNLSYKPQKDREMYLVISKVNHQSKLDSAVSSMLIAGVSLNIM